MFLGIGVIRQTTLADTAHCIGTGLHSGENAHLTLKPAAAGHGVRFYRTDLGDTPREVSALAAYAVSFDLGTTLANAQGDSVATVEHLMAACYGLGLDNVRVELDGPEVPILDGSASVFCDLIGRAGMVDLEAPRRVLRILEPVEVRDGDRWARLSPSFEDDLTLEARIDFPNDSIGVQEARVCLTSGDFQERVALARTFGFAWQVDALRARGLARGGSLDNAIVIDGDGVMNPEGLRCADEFVRHKLLDAIGDLALAGARLSGHYEANQPGHQLNNALLRKMLETTSAWCLTSHQRSSVAPVAGTSETAVQAML